MLIIVHADVPCLVLLIELAGEDGIVWDMRSDQRESRDHDYGVQGLHFLTLSKAETRRERGRIKDISFYQCLVDSLLLLPLGMPGPVEEGPVNSKLKDSKHLMKKIFIIKSFK